MPWASGWILTRLEPFLELVGASVQQFMQDPSYFRYIGTMEEKVCLSGTAKLKLQYLELFSSLFSTQVTIDKTF